MSRPYRHVDTETLKAKNAELFARIESLTNNHFVSLVRPFRRELKRVTKELDQRSKGEDFQR